MLYDCLNYDLYDLRMTMIFDIVGCLICFYQIIILMVANFTILNFACRTVGATDPSFILKLIGLIC